MSSWNGLNGFKPSRVSSRKQIVRSLFSRKPPQTIYQQKGYKMWNSIQLCYVLDFAFQRRQRPSPTNDRLTFQRINLVLNAIVHAKKQKTKKKRIVNPKASISKNMSAFSFFFFSIGYLFYLFYRSAKFDYRKIRVTCCVKSRHEENIMLMTEFIN